MAHDLERKLEEFVNQKKYGQCSKCSSEMTYMGSGTYTCLECGNIERNNYGKIRHFLSERGGATIPEISRGTGLRFSEVEEVIRNTDVRYNTNGKSAKRSIDLMDEAAKKSR